LKKYLIIWTFLIIGVHGHGYCALPGQELYYPYLQAKQLAEDNERSYVLYFSADWCMPCKWMEESTFQDEQVKQLLSEKIYLVKIDIDQFEGYALKEYYGVYSLPTFLLLSPNHKVINRREGAVSTSGLEEFIKNRSEASNENDSAKNKFANYSPLNEDLFDRKQEVDHKSAKEDIIKPNEKLLANVSKYSLQVGVFSSIENAKNRSGELRSITDQDIEIISETRGETYLYKVYVGRFDERQQAEILASSLKHYGIAVLIKSTCLSAKI
jgi:thiol-disulfide isomerase/thioredoxin